MKEFDYYMFIDYSENFIGYLTIENTQIKKLLPKIVKFSHYKELKHKKEYLSSIKKIIEKENIISFLKNFKIREVRKNLEIFSDITVFLIKNPNCLIFISIDDNQYSNFEKLVNVIDKSNTKVVKESELKKGSALYQISLILDTFLNIERIKYQYEHK